MINLDEIIKQGIQKAFYKVSSSLVLDKSPFDRIGESASVLDPRLVLKIAETKDELEACFRLLHDSYVDSGFMKKHNSGMRATIYHALPTTTTLCALYDGVVVGTMSLIRENALGFPMQSAFDLKEIREKGGNIAEVSALAVDKNFTAIGIFIPLINFLYHYCTSFFDVRHLVIAVNPRHIGRYEKILLFKRLKESAITNYDFANGAPAVGASLDLVEFKNHVFSDVKNAIYQSMKNPMPNIQMPVRRYFVTNDPVMTPDLLNYFFNEKTNAFECLPDRQKSLLKTIYSLPAFDWVLPSESYKKLIKIRKRDRQMYWINCPSTLSVLSSKKSVEVSMDVFEITDKGFLAYSKQIMPLNLFGVASICLGEEEFSVLKVQIVKSDHDGFCGIYGFEVLQSDIAWDKFVSVMKLGTVYEDLDNATRFLNQK